MESRDKTIRYQVHATKRMRRRGVDKELVERTIRTGKRGKAKRPDSTRFCLKLSPKRTIVVIAEEIGATIWVVTAFRK